VRFDTLLLIGIALAVGGCERGMHDMYAQAKYKTAAPAALFADGASSRPQVAGTIAVDAAPAVDAADASPVPITTQLVLRGRERFDIYCAPCHGRVGDGRGMIVLRGFPAPPSYHTDRLRDAPDSHFYQVISAGYGVMYPYADRIAPTDRWAIVAYIRALQLSQHAPAALLDAQDRAAMRLASP
jgi:mono/diheme cytochrome c family protein